jgi:flagellar biosynthesis protein FlhA
VFAILVVINFVVVTKGAERIAEVGARFTLDAMPGKQMAIDADLNAGLIDEKEAKRRRRGGRGGRLLRLHGRCQQVRARRRHRRHADPVHQHRRRLHHRHDQHGMSAGEGGPGYVLLAVGDALVAQIPALLISVAAAMVVSRVGKEQDIGSQIRGQVFGSRKALGITAGIVGSCWA